MTRAHLPACLAGALLLAGTLAPDAARAGAWPEPQGQWLDINTLSYYSVRVQGYNQFGRPSGAGRYQQVEFDPYVEYGLTDRVTLGAEPRLQVVRQSGLPATQTAAGLVQLNLFGRYQLWRGTWDVVSVQGGVNISGAQNQPEPQLAQQNTEYELRLLYGHSFELANHWSGFVNLEGAFREETNGWADQVRADGTFGLRPRPDWLLLVQSFNTIAVTHALPGEPAYDLYRVELSVVHDLTPHLAIQAGVWRDVSGHNVALGNAGIVALWLRF